MQGLHRVPFNRMNTAVPHELALAPGEWAFAEPENVLAFTTPRFLRGGEPILLVSHNHDGDWQFLWDDEEDC